MDEINVFGHGCVSLSFRERGGEVYAEKESSGILWG
jgi:hypothetical protein